MKKLIIFVLSVSLFFSCKKDSDKTCTQDMAGISGTHKITSVIYKASAAAPEQDFLLTLLPEACERDDQFVLSSSGTYTYVDAGVKCVPAGDDDGTWSASGNTFTLDGEVTTIQSFNCSTLVVLLVDNLVAGDQLKITFTRQ